ncbi:MAG: HNH endonuclease [Cyanobacteria bacterium]|nr:HNH endonuclease [Cyanobacteriota bacterium]
MARNPKDFSIGEQQLAECLKISITRLDEIVDFFDSDPNDEWDIKEGTHYIFLNKSQKERIFSELGAYAIAKYLDATQAQGIFDKVLEFFTHHKQKLRQSFIRRKIAESCAPIVLYNHRSYLSKKSTVSILCTSYAKLNSVFEEMKRSETPLIIDEDFVDLEGTRHYSFSGFYKISSHLGDTLTKKDRQEWCRDAVLVSKKEFKRLEDSIHSFKKRVDSAKSRAKSRDKQTCQITGRKPNKEDKFDLAAHHVFSQAEYPHLADNVENILTLDAAIHKKFHQWLGGSGKPCTIDDLIDFVETVYPHEERAISRLFAIKKKLGPQQPSEPDFQVYPSA